MKDVKTDMSPGCHGFKHNQNHLLPRIFAWELWIKNWYLMRTFCKMWLEIEAAIETRESDGDYHWEDRHWFPFQFGQTTANQSYGNHSVSNYFFIFIFFCSILRLKRKEWEINMVSLMPRTNFFTLSSGMHSNQSLKATGGPGRMLVTGVVLLGRFNSVNITLLYLTH